MRNIRKFETFEDFVATQEAMSGTGQYVQDIWPGFAYIKERFPDAQYAIYNGIEDNDDYEFGDVIYYDGTDKLKKVFWSAYTEDMGQKVGLVVIPSSMTPDGNARIISFGVPEANAENENASDNKGSTREVSESETITPASFYFTTNFLHGEQNWYDTVIGYNISNGIASSVNPSRGEGVIAGADGQKGGNTTIEGPYPNLIGSFYDPSVFSSDLNRADGNEVLNPDIDGEAWHNISSNDYNGFLSPYTNEGTLNEYYAREEYTEEGLPDEIVNVYHNAFSDFSGLTWTKMMINGTPEDVINSGEKGGTKAIGLLGSSPYQAAQEYVCPGTQAGDWYVPAAGEIGFVAAKYWEICKIFLSLDVLSHDFGYSQPIFFPDEEGYGSMIGNNLITSTMIYDDSEQNCPYLYPLFLSPQFMPDDGGDSPQSEGDMPLGASIFLNRGNTPSTPAEMYEYLSSMSYYGQVLGGMSLKPFLNDACHVIPMAMINAGEIVTETGTPRVNGMQVSDVREHCGGGPKA